MTIYLNANVTGALKTAPANMPDIKFWLLASNLLDTLLEEFTTEGMVALAGIEG
jgi:hypothetical protein